MRNRVRRGDDGALLIVVLIIITSLALVTTVVLGQLDSNVRSTVALRDATGSDYNGDAAAQVAIDQLVNDNFAGTSGSCSTTDKSVVLKNFYPPAFGNSTTAASSAYVACTHDSSNSSSGSATSANTSPGSALLTLDPNLTEAGLYANVNAGPVKIRGGVFSNSAISAAGGLVNVWSPPTGSTASTYNIARGACSPTTDRSTKGVWVATPAYGSTTCNYTAADARGTDPGLLSPHGASYNTPTAPTANAVISPCASGDKYQKVTAGRFSGAAALAALNGLTGCTNAVVWFQPGTYYFDLPGIWNVPPVNLVGGTFNNTYADVTKAPAQWSDATKACVVPGDSAATTSTGVEFVFGGATQLGVNSSAGNGTQMTICASNSASGPPIAIYGLKSALTGTYPVAAESSCTPSGTGSTPCAVITTGNSPKSTLTIQGTTYVPTGVINVTLNNNTKKIFYWGLISWATEFAGTGSADVSNALVDVPDAAANPTPSPQIVYLTVYVCAGSSTCSASGQVELKAKVKITPGSPQTATVLSWSRQG